MIAIDFEYDGLRLSDFDYIIGSLDGSSGTITSSSGSAVTLNTVPMFNGQRQDYVGYSYDECLSGNFQIIKLNCIDYDDYIFSKDELRFLSRWLCRKGFYKLKLLDEDGEYAGIHYEASFTMEKIELGDNVVGVNLTVKTNRPFALGEEITNTYSSEDSDWSFSINNMSDEEGILYPTFTFTATSAGDLTIYSDIEDRTTTVNNLVADEVITMDYPIITTSVSTHTIQNDFDWNFFRLTEEFQDKTNTFTVSLPGTLTITYTPIVKVGM